MSSFEDKQLAFDEILKTMIELLPSSYNKEVTDTNYYKLLRAFALQLADAKIEIKEMGDNRYLETAATPQAIYDNFGILVKLQKNPDWDTEKYRGLIKGVMQSLLKGPNKESMIESFKLFTNFKTNIYELYKDFDKLDKTAYEGYNPKYTFALEIEKPIDEYVDQDILLRDANYVINIIKPAHTLSINIITIVGEENYRRYYRIDRKLGQVTEKCINRKVENNLNQKLAARFDNEAVDYADLHSISVNEAKEILRSMSNGLSIDAYEEAIEQLASQKYNSYVSSLTQCDVQMETLDLFRIDARVDMRGTLELKWLKEERDQVFKEDYIDYTKEQVNEMIEAKKAEIVQLCENDYICNPSDLTEAQWYNKALNILKEESLRRRILNELGGEPKVRQECATSFEQYRTELEKSYISNSPYCGMDSMLFEAELINNEGSYGWHHVGYDNQFITNTNKNVSKIGGARLIGPRYLLNDSAVVDAYQLSEDVRTKPFEDQLTEFGSDITETYDKYEEDLFEISIYDFKEPKFKDATDERSILFEELLNEKVRFAFQYNDFTFEKSEMPEEDLLVAYRAEMVEHLEVEGLTEMMHPVFEDFLYVLDMNPFETYDTKTKVKDTYANEFVLEEKVNFLSNDNESQFSLNNGEINNTTLYNYSSDLYSLSVDDFKETFKKVQEETSGRMFKIVNGSEVEIDARAI